MTALVIGLGSHQGGDDAVGLLVADQLQYAGPAGLRVVTTTEPTQLWELWDGHDDVLVIDCVRSGDAPGTVTVRSLDALRLPHRGAARGTHGFGLAEAVGLARALDRMPRSLVLIGVEGASVDAGSGLSPAVADAVPTAVAAVLRELQPSLLRPGTTCSPSPSM